MENPETSAFAAYANKFSKKRGNLGINPHFVLNKKKKKRRRKFEEIKVENAFLMSHSSDDNKDLVKSFISAEEESIFKNCNPNGKVGNVFLNEKPEEVSSNVKKNKHQIEKKMKTGNKIKKVKWKNDGCENTLDDDEFQGKSKKLKLDEGDVEKDLVKFGDSVKMGEEVFSWMLSPVDVKDFFKNFWEQKPLLIKHKDENYFKSLCTLEDFRTALEVNEVYFTRNIDVTSYIDGERATENPMGRAKACNVWKLFSNGRSIRMLNPQTYIPNIRLLNTFLQEFFQCFVGGNIYLTPAGTQGFAPHYDDIEAFVLQLEGKKQWKVYKPRGPDEVLPRESSENFKEDEIGEPVLEVVLSPGDVLYFPRGFIHQAKCLPDIHSLHLTVSCYQKNSWADFMEKILPVALDTAINEDVEFRKGLPIGFLNHLGLVYSDDYSNFKKDFVKKFEELAQKLVAYCPVDAGVDQIAADFMHAALPPYLSKDEIVHGTERDEKIKDKCLEDVLKNYSYKNLGVKLIRAFALRLVSEGNDIVVYYTTNNSLVYHEHEPFSAVIPPHWAEAIECLVKSYPKFTKLKEFMGTKVLKEPWTRKQVAEFVYFLWEKGLVLFDKPLLHILS